MEETFLKLAASLGGFAGIAFFGLVWFIGRRLLLLIAAIDRQTRMELLRLAVSPHVSADVKNQLKAQLEEVEDAIKEQEK